MNSRASIKIAGGAQAPTDLELTLSDEKSARAVSQYRAGKLLVGYDAAVSLNRRVEASGLMGC